MVDSNASQKALEKIMKGKITQKSRWRFVVRNTFLWILGFFSVIAGAIVVSVIIFTLINSDMDLHREIYGYVMSGFTMLFIIVWIVITGGFMALCDMSIRNTRRGYIYPLWVILVGDVLLSIFFGSIFYFSGMGCFIDRVLGAHIYHYQDVETRRATLFHKPEHGILMGQIVDSVGNSLEVITQNGDMWIVFVDELPEYKITSLVEGRYVVFAGQMNDEHLFVACDAKVRNMYGATKELQQKQIDTVIRQQQQQHDMFLQKAQQHPQDNLCNGEIHWRVYIEQ